MRTRNSSSGPMTYCEGTGARSLGENVDGTRRNRSSPKMGRNWPVVAATNFWNSVGRFGGSGSACWREATRDCKVRGAFSVPELPREFGLGIPESPEERTCELCVGSSAQSSPGDRIPFAQSTDEPCCSCAESLPGKDCEWSPGAVASKSIAKESARRFSIDAFHSQGLNPHTATRFRALLVAIQGVPNVEE